MNIQTDQIQRVAVPERLRNLYDPPQQLYVRGEGWQDLLNRPRLAIVGSRRITPYGLQITRQLAGQAAARGIVIISGLAYGVDAVAHRAALEAGGLTMAVLAGGLDGVYPRSHTPLANEIVHNGGCLVSEYPAGTPPMKHRFIARNRLVTGLADVLLITEAARGSGSLHTADFALQLGQTVCAVPGNITAASSAGTNKLIQSGATPVFTINDILAQFDAPHDHVTTPEAPQHPLVALVAQGVSDGETLLARSGLPAAEFNAQLTRLELNGELKSLGGDRWIPGCTT